MDPSQSLVAEDKPLHIPGAFHHGLILYTCCSYPSLVLPDVERFKFLNVTPDTVRLTQTGIGEGTRHNAFFP